MTVTQAQIDRVRQAGFVNVELIADATNKVTEGRFWLSVSMIEKESKGRNVYGHDAGGALSGYPREVNLDNYRVLEWMVLAKGHTPNGVGPAQITHPDLLRQMKEMNLRPDIARDNIYFGVRHLTRFYRNAFDVQNLTVWEAVQYAGRKYNGSSAYGDSLVTVAKKWREILGNADYV
jgi:hypothetical protein